MDPDISCGSASFWFYMKLASAAPGSALESLDSTLLNVDAATYTISY